jgi:beta-N-acetylhexosaminidase
LSVLTHLSVSKILITRIIFFCFVLAVLAACERHKAPHKVVVFEAPQILPEDTIRYSNALITTLNRRNAWVDSVFKKLTPEQRITQLMVVEAFPNKGQEHVDDVLHLIRRYNIGGIIYFQGGPIRQTILTNKFQAAAKVPLLISMDAESGVGMRIDSAMQYPLPMLLGAINNDSLIYRMGAEIAYEFKRLGMHLNFAPVVDINNNPNNPVISYRSFGENKKDVTSKSLAYMLGMQEHGIIATAKHFPGHGDTDVDSHLDLPVIPYGRERLDTLELYPFRELIKSGVGGIMVAHMHLPMLDSTKNLPTTLSRPVVTGLLREELDFAGLIITDALVMKGVTKYFEPGETEVMALVAGNDILERLVSVPIAIKAIQKAIKDGVISQKEIDRRCKKVLAAKYWVGLNRYKPVSFENLYQDLHTSRAHETNRRLAEGAITLLHNKRGIIPLEATKDKKKKLAVLAIGANRPTFFQRKMAAFTPIEAYMLPRKSTKKNREALLRGLKKHKQLVIAIYGPSIRPSNNLGLLPEEKDLINKLIREKRVVVSLFDNAYTMNQIADIDKANGLIMGYQQLPAIQEAAAKLIFGKIKPNGKLPVTVNDHFKYGDGL